ncbi:hypothetical protein [Acinetobacter pragensis]|uniref:Uncharacterized protein n=1 Tax=Acinetobacter pragensis TaxID=1806892 RepID=A0A151Y573_9GAMM|nr:hypothetical protein [Acinetobacter pragensis]KYQ73130.1 hypothetical protein AZH43_06740 [Acinetobacter pragensis]
MRKLALIYVEKRIFWDHLTKNNYIHSVSSLNSRHAMALFSELHAALQILTASSLSQLHDLIYKRSGKITLLHGCTAHYYQRAKNISPMLH